MSDFFTPICGPMDPREAEEPLRRPPREVRQLRPGGRPHRTRSQRSNLFASVSPSRLGERVLSVHVCMYVCMRRWVSPFVFACASVFVFLSLALCVCGCVI